MNAVKTNVLILKTNIKTKKKVKTIKPILNNHPSIINWAIDTEDIDNVLRIEATENIVEKDIVIILKLVGIYGEDLKT